MSVTASGVIEPIRRVEIRSKASGAVVELPVVEGQRIEKGSLIARLDATDARADLERAKANLSIAETEERQSTRELKRQRDLFERQLISEAEVDVAELAASRARASHIVAQTELRRAEDRFDARPRLDPPPIWGLPSPELPSVVAPRTSPSRSGFRAAGRRSRGANYC